MKARGFMAAIVVCFVARLASAAAPRTLTDLDDARACLPLAGGGIAVATGGGLAVVGKDGRVRTLTALDGLPDTRVHAIAADGDALWVGTDSGAARVSLAPELAVSRTVAVADAAVHAVLVTTTGVYLGTWGAGLLHLSVEDASPELVPTSAGGKRIAALAEHGGSVYVAYADGPLTRLDKGRLSATFETPAHGQALATIARRDGGGSDLLLGDLEGLFRVEEGVTPVMPIDARGMADGSGGALLVATYGGGLLAGSTRGALRRELGVPSFVNGVSARGGVRCAATTDGVFVDTDGHGYKRVALGAIPSNDVTVVEEHAGRVAVGTFDRGAAIVEGDAIRRVQGLEPMEAINAAAWQGDGAAAALWLGTAHGAVCVGSNGALRRLRAADGLPSSFVRAILVRPDGRVLLGTDGGAVFLHGEHVVPIAPVRKDGPVPLASPMHATWALAASPDGMLWLGTTVGLYFGKGDSFHRVALATEDLKDDWVTALAVRGSDIFVGTYAGGVTRLHTSNGRLEHVHLGGGCINPGGLSFVGDELYAATMEGLLVRPAGDDAAAWVSKSQATPGRDVTVVRKVGDALWVASRRGIGVTRL